MKLACSERALADLERFAALQERHSGDPPPRARLKVAFF
jgi:hypothetical protein